jgi:predicted nucleic acid-binding protein
MVDGFTESDAESLAALISALRRRGETMNFFDAGIAAGVIARGDKLLALDGDYDRLKGRLTVLSPL